MKQTTIQFTFDDAKVTAIKLYLEGKEAELNSELLDFMESLYKKNVPLQVREYLDKLDKIEPEEAPKTEKPKRRATQPTCADSAVGQANTPPQEQVGNVDGL